jgi:hypothetical protein
MLVDPPSKILYQKIRNYDLAIKTTRVGSGEAGIV